MKFIDVFDCSMCPCHSDEDGCNLGYSTLLRWREDKEFIDSALSCKLESVTFENEIFKKRLVKATETNPKDWR